MLRLETFFLSNVWHRCPNFRAVPTYNESIGTIALEAFLLTAACLCAEASPVVAGGLVLTAGVVALTWLFRGCVYGSWPRSRREVLPTTHNPIHDNTAPTIVVIQPTPPPVILSPTTHHHIFEATDNRHGNGNRRDPVAVSSAQNHRSPSPHTVYDHRGPTDPTDQPRRATIFEARENRDIGGGRGHRDDVARSSADIASSSADVHHAAGTRFDRGNTDLSAGPRVRLDVPGKGIRIPGFESVTTNERPQIIEAASNRGNAQRSATTRGYSDERPIPISQPVISNIFNKGLGQGSATTGNNAGTTARPGIIEARDRR